MMKEGKTLIPRNAQVRGPRKELENRLTLR